MSSARPEPGRGILIGQLVLAVITSILLLPVFGLVTAYSGFMGGLISVLANSIFAIRLFDDKGSWQAEQLAASMYRGLLGKYFLTIALFVLAVVLVEPINITALFAAYLWIQVSPVMIAVIVKK